VPCKTRGSLESSCKDFPNNSRCAADLDTARCSGCRSRCVSPPYSLLRHLQIEPAKPAFIVTDQVGIWLVCVSATVRAPQPPRPMRSCSRFLSPPEHAVSVESKICFCRIVWR